jgi:Ni/Co efflux regulator RcnB
MASFYGRRTDDGRMKIPTFLPSGRYVWCILAHATSSLTMHMIIGVHRSTWKLGVQFSKYSRNHRYHFLNLKYYDLWSPSPGHSSTGGSITSFAANTQGLGFGSVSKIPGRYCYCQMQ